MTTVFLICAVVGGTILVLQLVFSLLGLGLDQFGGADLGGGDASLGDLVGGGDGVGHDVGGGLGGGDVDLPDGDLGPSTTHGDHHNGVNLGRLLTFQTILALVTFFGIGGLAALESGQSVAVACVVAAATGLAVMLTAAVMFGSLNRLHDDGALRLDALAGAPGRVYLTIPGFDSGVGKATVIAQGREVELAARTPGPDLRSGDAIVVTRRLDEWTIEVVAASAYVPKPQAMSSELA